MRTFTERLLLQKRVYFIQQFGAPLGYSFGWYAHGPYSPELARDGFEIENVSKIVNRDWTRYVHELPQIGKEVPVDTMARFFESVRRAAEELAVPESTFMEVISSLHFVRENWFQQDDDFSESARELSRVKVGLSDPPMEEAVQKSRQILLAFLPRASRTDTGK
jgi:uncharacterized protein YwgA